MSFLAYVSTLYRPSHHWSDSLIEPQRWCEKQWTHLPSLSSDDSFSSAGVKVGKIAALAVLTLSSCLLGLAGAAIKATTDDFPLLEFDRPTSLSERQVVMMKIRDSGLSDLWQYHGSRFQADISSERTSDPLCFMVTRRNCR